MMRAAVFHGNGELRVEDREMPQPAVDEVVVRVEACGVCGSDLQIVNVPPGHPSTPPVVIGHEFVGRVSAVGAAAGDIRVGQRVTVDPDPKCGHCYYCRAGRPANCENIVALGVYRDGALAEYVAAPASAVYPVAEDVPAEIAALIEPLACVANGANRANVRPGESAVIFGAGTIGCLFLALFKAAGANPVVVVEPSEPRRRVACDVGADHALTPEEFAARRAELLPAGADVLVDAVGTQFATCVEHSALGARIILFGQNANARPPIHQFTITERSLTVMGTYITAYTFPTAIRLIEQGTLPFAPIVTHVRSLEQLDEGLALLRSGEATKVVLVP
jgi:2-desacetyl-2-hydroxyethyl bacteriochlorophyllide A dehydrogenase